MLFCKKKFYKFTPNLLFDKECIQPVEEMLVSPTEPVLAPEEPSEPPPAIMQQTVVLDPLPEIKTEPPDPIIIEVCKPSQYLSYEMMLH